MTEESKKYNVGYSSDATEDLDIIYSYISGKLFARKAAKRIVRRIREQVRSLDMFPERHPLAPEERLASAGLRKVAVENYVIYYKIDESAATVTIAKIMYGGRNAESIIRSSKD